MRERRVLVLPTVDLEMQRHVGIVAARYIQRKFGKSRRATRERLRQAVMEAERQALQWWQEEVGRNDSCFLHVGVGEAGSDKYREAESRLPASAFSGENPADRDIYAEAWVHGADVLASRNVRTTDRNEIEEWFLEAGEQGMPVEIRGLWEHTVKTARSENRPAGEVAVEAIMGAVVSEGMKAENMVEILTRCSMFASNLATAIPANAQDEAGIGENELVRAIWKTAGLSGDIQLLERLRQNAVERLPSCARETESRLSKRTKGVDAFFA